MVANVNCPMPRNARVPCDGYLNPTAEAHHFERELVALGWYSRHEFARVATKYGLTPRRLGNAQFRVIALYLLHCAETGAHPNQDECTAWIEKAYSMPVCRESFTRFLVRGQRSLLRCFFDRKKSGTTTAERLDACAAAVAHWAKAREELE